MNDSTPIAPMPAPNPWLPMRDPIALKHLGKLAEELAEAGAATARCIIQGIDEREPVTGKPNREWLEDEIADVLANAQLVMDHFGLDMQRIHARAERKKVHLRAWHAMADGAGAKPKIAMTARQIELARHALGLNRQPVSYRNRFVAGPEHSDHPEWMAMVRGGYATHIARPRGFGGDDVFEVSQIGALAALRPGERLDGEDFPGASE